MMGTGSCCCGEPGITCARLQKVIICDWTYHDPTLVDLRIRFTWTGSGSPCSTMSTSVFSCTGGLTATGSSGGTNVEIDWEPEIDGSDLIANILEIRIDDGVNQVTATRNNPSSFSDNEFTVVGCSACFTWSITEQYRNVTLGGPATATLYLPITISGAANNLCGTCTNINGLYEVEVIQNSLCSVTYFTLTIACSENLAISYLSATGSSKAKIRFFSGFVPAFDATFFETAILSRSFSLTGTIGSSCDLSGSTVTLGTPHF